MPRGYWRFWKSKSTERDLKIHLLTVENQDLAESNKVLKYQVTLLQETLLVGKVEWQGMKDVGKSGKESVVEIRDGLSSKTSKVEGKAVEQAYTQGVKSRDEEKGGFTNNSKTWAQVISNSSNMEKEANNQGGNMQDR
jgi:hypothetical protein